MTQFDFDERSTESRPSRPKKGTRPLEEDDLTTKANSKQTALSPARRSTDAIK